MLEFEDFGKLVAEIERQGIEHETACHYAALIGDTPCFDEQGRIVVQEKDGHELARLKLRFFDSPKTLTLDGDAYLTPFGLLVKLSKKQFECALESDKLNSPESRDCQELANEYDARFGNFGEIAIADILFEPAFLELLRTAIARGQALTPEEVRAAFPGAAWEY